MGPDGMIFTLLLMAFLFTILGLIVYPIYRVLQNRGHVKSAKALVWGFIIVFVYSCYREINPSDSFFIGLFKSYTALPYPESAEIEYKSASSPDPHGKTYDCIRMVLSSEDYKKLMEGAAKGDREAQGEGSERWSCQCTKTTSPALKCISAFKIKAPFPTAETMLYFYDDNKTVVAYFKNY